MKKFRYYDRGKVRDLYKLDNTHLLMVTTDRVSAFDHVLPQAIPEKGVILNNMSKFWMGMTDDIVKNHISNEISMREVFGEYPEEPEILKRSLIVKKLKPIRLECIVRGYLFGSCWNEYQQTGRVAGIVMPEGMPKGYKFKTPLFTPSTKEVSGKHDINITESEFIDKCLDIYGIDGGEIIHYATEIYNRANDYASKRGIVICDTKLEFGLDEENGIHLIDEILTPDSSRFWLANDYERFINNEVDSINSFDKQYIRDYLETILWNKKEPVPNLPEEIVSNTANRYKEIHRRLLC